MAEKNLDSLAQRLATADRRSLVRAVAGAALGVFATRLQSEEISSKSKQKRCKKQAQLCERDVVGYCNEVWPDDAEACIRGLGRCCAYDAKCEFAKTDKCGRQSKWFR